MVRKKYDNGIHYEHMQKIQLLLQGTTLFIFKYVICASGSLFQNVLAILCK